MKITIKRFVFYIFALLQIDAFSQTDLIPLNRYYKVHVLSSVNHSDSIIHTAFQPYITNNLSGVDTSVIQSFLPIEKVNNRSWFYRKLKKENFIFIKKKDFLLRIDPLFCFQTGKESETTDYKLYTNTRGLIVRGNIGKHLYFQSDIYENQGFFPTYLTDYIKDRFVVPGQGRIRIFKINGFDYSSSSGLVSYSPKSFLNIQFGHGKNFIGEGYRSLLLSDNTYNYPFAKFTFTHKKFQYTTMFTSFINVLREDNPDLVHHTKYGTFSLLNYAPCKSFQVGLFEGIIWHTSDSTYNNRFSPWYFVPVPLYRTFKYGMNDLNNVVLGLNASARIGNSVKLYGQLVADDFANADIDFNKTGFQLGGYVFNPFKFKGFTLQLEYNHVNPYTYSFLSAVNQNYSHFSQPLAHPLGANFNEAIVMIDYTLKDFFIHLRYSYVMQPTGYEVIGGQSFPTGSDIFTEEYNYIGPSLLNSNSYNDRLIYKTIEIGYRFNKTTNFQLFLGINWRNVHNENITRYDALYIYGGIKTNLKNYYTDI